MLDLLPGSGPCRTFSQSSSRFASSCCTGPPSSSTSSSLETRLSSLSLDEEGGRAESPVLSVCLGKRSASLSMDSPVATPRRSTWAGTCHDNALPKPRSLDDGSGSPHLRVKRRYRATMSGQEALLSSANWCQRLASVYFVDYGLEDPDVPQRLDELRSRIKKQKTWEQRPSNLSSSGSGALGAVPAPHGGHGHVPRTASEPREGML